MRPDNKYVFVGGLHRSGTTLVYRCLGEHPEISVFRDTGAPRNEGMFLQSIFKPARDYGGPGRFGFHPEARLTERSELVTPENRRKLKGEWHSYWDTEKLILAEKSPPNIIRSRFLQEMFERSHFVIVLRHPIATSYATKKWSHTGIHSLLRHWLRCHELFDADRSYLERVLIVKYEHLVTNPTSEVRRIWNFLGVEEADVDVEVQTGLNDKYFALWEARKSKSLARLHADVMIRLYEARMNHFGYSLRDLDIAGPY